MGIIRNIVRLRQNKKNILVLPYNGDFERMLVTNMPDYRFYIIGPDLGLGNLPNISYISNYNTLDLDYFFINRDYNGDLANGIIIQTQSRPIYISHRIEHVRGFKNAFRDFSYHVAAPTELPIKNRAVLHEVEVPLDHAKKAEMFGQSKYYLCEHKNDEFNTNMVYAYTYGCIPVCQTSVLTQNIINHLYNGILYKNLYEADSIIQALEKDNEKYNLLLNNCLKFAQEFFGERDFEKDLLQ